MKKIYIHTDLEGCSGIGRGEMVEKENPDYMFCVQRLMADVNAAIEGAFLGGADHVTVLDSHGGGGNFDMSLLDARAQYDPKENKKWWGMLENSYWGCFFIGAHAMAGTLNGFLDHTQCSKKIYNYFANNRKIGELGQWAMVSGHFEVPMLMVSGDLCAINEAVQFFDGVETAVVKTGLSRLQASLLPPEEAENLIRHAAKKAVEKSIRPAPFKPLLPMEVKIEYTRGDYCDEVIKEGVERLDTRTARKIVDNYLDFWM